MLKFNLVNKWEEFQMNNSPKGPYQHYERPNKGRSDGEQPKGGHWGAVISVLLIILVVLIPIVYRTASAHYGQSEKAKEVQRVSNSSSSKKVKKAKKTAQSTKKTQSSSKSSKVSNQKKATNSSSKTKQSSSSQTAKTYVVQDGDTLTSIAQKEGVSVSSLVSINNLSSAEDIQAGQTIRLR